MDVLRAVKSLNLVEFVQQRIEIVRSGSVWQGKCPFHPDQNTPSLTVWSNNSWKCFGCGLGGDIVDFQMNWTGSSFVEALEDICLIHHIDFSSSGLPEPECKDVQYIRRIKERSMLVFLPELDPWLLDKYRIGQSKTLREEGWSDETLTRFNIGYCNDPYDPLYGRITIPIFDETGRLVGFAGRATNSNKSRKYVFLNSTKKTSLLYGLDLALPYIEQKKEMVIVEGYKDCWRACEAGIKNTVALMGAEASPQQIKLILKYGNYNIVLVLDNDEAGRKGEKKLVETLHPWCKIRRVDLQQFKDFGECDPDEVLRLFTSCA